MHVDNDGQPLLLGASDSKPGIPPREKAQVSASSYQQTVLPDPEGRKWILNQWAGRRFNAKWGAGRRWYSVSIMTNGKDAGIVSESQVHENLERPQGAGDNGISGGPVSIDSQSGDLLDYVLCALGVLAELLWIELVNQAVPVGMAG